MTSGYSAVLLPQLQHANSSIAITADEASWIASMAALPMAIGCILGGICMERYGRRMAHLVLNVPFICGWLIISMAGSLNLILLGRFLTGLCVGLLGPPASVYIGETSGPRYRGFLLAAVSLAIAAGILISHVLGTFLPWHVTAAICGTFPLISFVLMSLAPESPSWLLAHGRLEEAAFAFRWLRGGDAASAREFDSMVAAQSTAPAAGNYAWSSVRSSVRRAAFLRPLGILIGFFVTMQFAGVNAVAFYSVTIMRQTIGAGVNEYLAMIVIDVVRFGMSIVACVLLRSTGRRPLAAISGIGTAVSLLGLAAFLYAAGVWPTVLRHSWLPMLLLVAFICFVSVGLVPLPWCMTGELFPLALRGLGSGVVSCMNFVSFFVVVKTGPLLFAGVGPEGAFLLYGSVALVGTMFLMVCLPETRNRTLQEIEDSFGGSPKDGKPKARVVGDKEERASVDV